MGESPKIRVQQLVGAYRVRCQNIENESGNENYTLDNREDESDVVNSEFHPEMNP